MIYKGKAGILRRSEADLQPCLHAQAGFPAQRNGVYLCRVAAFATRRHTGRRWATVGGR